MNKTNFLLISLLIIGLFISGCAPYPDDPNVVATNVALGTPPPPSYLTAIANSLGTATPPGDERTVDIAATMIYDEIARDATADAIEREIMQQEAAMTSTAISIESTATYKAEMAAQATQGAREAATAYAANQFATATQQAFVVQATASKDAWSANATQTQQTWQVTATADATLHELEIKAMITQQAADAIRLEGESRQIELAVARQEIKNTADAVLPWAIVIIILLILAGLAYFTTRFRMVKRNPDGSVDIPLLRGDRGWTVLQPSRLPMFGATIRDDGVIEYQAPEDTEEQSETTRRDQIVEAMRALPPGREKEAIQLAAQSLGADQEITDPEIEVLSPNSSAASAGMGPVLDELEGQVINE
jgi:hypothetical protein